VVENRLGFLRFIEDDPDQAITRWSMNPNEVEHAFVLRSYCLDDVVLGNAESEPWKVVEPEIVADSLSPRRLYISVRPPLT
jgi:hypothetical protein